MSIINLSQFFSHPEYIYKNFKQHKLHQCLCSEADFIAVLKQERERSDRNGQKFSLIAFDVSPEITKEKTIRLLLRSIICRLRSIDEAGWVNTDKIGVILPGATFDGANVFAETIQRKNRDTMVDLKYSIFTYPEDKSDNNRIKKSAWELHPRISNALNPKAHDTNKVKHLSAHETNDYFPGLLKDTKPGSVYPVQPGNVCSSIHTLFVRKIPFWKRFIDVTGSMLGLLIFAPLFLVLSILIKMASQGPVFFKQERIGYGCEPFTLYKFRTMKSGSDSFRHKQYLSELINNSIKGTHLEKPMNKLEDDPRIIPFGKFLRKSCLDELPQLINVFLGHMSLVGPRPPIQYEVEEYINWHKERLDILPGMTGLWQVNGKNNLTFQQMVRLDIQYIKNISFLFDLKILIKTPFAIIGQMINKQLSAQPDSTGVKQNA